MVEDNVGDPVPGGIYTCKPRMAQDILQAAERDPLSWQFGGGFEEPAC